MHRVVVVALLVSVYLRGKNVYMYSQPPLLPEATLPPGTCLAEYVQTSDEQPKCGLLTILSLLRPPSLAASPRLEAYIPRC
jgi:hypothetical protein